MRQPLFVLLLTFLTAPALAQDKPQIAPDWQLTSADGASVRLSEVAGEQTSILFFWATWCPYCKALMPHLQSMKIEYGDRIEVFAISVFDDGDPAGFVRDAGYDFTVLLDGDGVAGDYGITGTPGVLIVDRRQAVQFDLRGLQPLELPEKWNNRRKAAYLAPYWAAEVRKRLDTALAAPTR